MLHTLWQYCFIKASHTHHEKWRVLHILFKKWHVLHIFFKSSNHIFLSSNLAFHIKHAIRNVSHKQSGAPCWEKLSRVFVFSSWLITSLTSTDFLRSFAKTHFHASFSMHRHTFACHLISTTKKPHGTYSKEPTTREKKEGAWGWG